MYTCEYLHICVCTLSVPVPTEAIKIVLNFLEIELQAVVSYVMWVLGGELRFSAGVVSAFSHGAISPVSLFYSL